jgi:hypothetical protein
MHKGGIRLNAIAAPELSRQKRKNLDFFRGLQVSPIPYLLLNPA